MGSLSDRVNVGVGVIVQDEEGNVLLGRRADQDKHGTGEYSFPGGKPDPGEDPSYTAARELYEETLLPPFGLTKLDVWTYDRFPDDGIHFVTLYYVVTLEGVRPPVENPEPHKCAGWEWFERDALPEPLFSGVEEALPYA